MTHQEINQAIKQLSDNINEIEDWDLQNLKNKITDELERRKKRMVHSIKEMIQLAAEEGRTIFCYDSSQPGKSTVSESTATEAVKQIREKGRLFEFNGEVWEVKDEIEYSKAQSYYSKQYILKAEFHVQKRSAVQKL